MCSPDRVIVTMVSPQVYGWSNLILSYTTTADSGNYSCHPDNLHPATVSLHVLSKDGEHLPVTGQAQANTPHFTLADILMVLLALFLP